ncbi:MAG: hypothetical protein ACPGJV_09370 [Bacteriovoracaceae bacterium]
MKPKAIDKKGEVFVHQASGFKIPTNLESLFRLNVIAFNSDHSNIGIGYSGKESKIPIEVTAYFYPAKKVSTADLVDSVAKAKKEGSCSNEISSSDATIRMYNQQLKLLKREKYSKINWRNQKLVTNRFYYDVLGTKGKSLLSHYCPLNSSWMLKIRASYHKDFPGDEFLKRFEKKLLEAI